MQAGDEPRVDDVLSEITTLLAAAYQRRARIRLIRPVAGPLPSTEDLDNMVKRTGATREHGANPGKSQNTPS